MERKALKSYIVGGVDKICQTKDIADRKTLFDELVSVIREDLEGIDYMEYKDGVVTNTYINFDSCCGLSLIMASADIEQLFEYTHEKDLSLAAACTVLSDICERDEYQDDLVDEEYNFKYSPVDTAAMLVSVLDNWKGTGKLDKDFLRLKRVKENAKWKK